MSTSDYEKLNHILKAGGHRTTQARRLIFQLLVGSDPLSIGQLLKKAGDKIDRVTLYRNVELFEKLGIVHRIHIGWKYKVELSDAFIEHHHHLSCLKCGKIIAIEDEKHIDEFIEKLANKFSFTPRRHQFEIDGYCLHCSDEAKS